ncbi:DUF6602 domain-containing protein [Lentzea sp. NPDC005914]|uniref:DUF6602 domain-containing protein n=1 Tax=Lentzea sp. NPDC005914 TaxID=3154572 RepID=UPI0033D79356
MTNLTDRFRAYEAELQASLARTRASFQHAGVKGGEVESSFRTFLSQHLPRRWTVGTGEIVDRQSRRSPQMDVVISNQDQPFRSEQDTPGLMVIEGVGASCEVKTRLNKKELADCIEKGRKLKQLRNQHLAGDMIHSNESDRARFYDRPPYFAVCFENSVAIDTVGEILSDLEPVETTNGVAIPPIDAIFFLGLGCLINYGDGEGALRIHWSEEGKKATGSDIAKGWVWMESDHTLVNLLPWLDSSMPIVQRLNSIAVNYYQEAANPIASMKQYGWRAVE